MANEGTPESGRDKAIAAILRTLVIETYVRLPAEYQRGFVTDVQRGAKRALSGEGLGVRLRLKDGELAEADRFMRLAFDSLWEEIDLWYPAEPREALQEPVESDPLRRVPAPRPANALEGPDEDPEAPHAKD